MLTECAVFLDFVCVISLFNVGALSFLQCSETKESSIQSVHTKGVYVKSYPI